MTKTDSGGKVTYGYTADDQVSSVTDPQSQQTTIGYDVDGNRTSIAFANGVTESMQYNGARQLTQISAKKGTATLTSFSYSYTNPGNGKATALRYSVTMPSGTTNYSYDSLERLTQASGPSSTYTYGYDNAGNLTNDNGTTQQFNAANELTQAGSTTYSFDANGNETGNSAGLSVQYNSQDQTTSVTPPGGSAVSMTYTGEGQAMRVSAGSISYQYDTTGLASMTQSGSTTYFTRLPDGTPLAERTSSGTYDYLVDGLGSMAALTDSSGTVVNTYSYDPYGNTVNSTGSTSNPFRFDGAYLDSTGFYKMGERFYDPSVGRWTQMDRMPGLLIRPQTLDRYAFVRGDPINLVDLSGTNVNDVLAGAALGGALVCATTVEIPPAAAVACAVAGVLFAFGYLVGLFDF